MSVREELVTAADAAIVHRLADHGDPDLVALAYEAGRRRMGASVSNLMLLLDCGDPDVRLGALEALGEIGDAQAGERVVEVLTEATDRALRDTAAWTLGLLRYRPAVQRLAFMLSAPEPTVRSCASAALVAIGDKTAWPAIRFQLERERDPAVQADLRAAEASLKPIGNPERDAARAQPKEPPGDSPMNDPGKLPPLPKQTLPRTWSHG